MNERQRVVLEYKDGRLLSRIAVGLRRREVVDLGIKHGLTRNTLSTIPCSGCGRVCHPAVPVDPKEPTSGCFCMLCEVERRTSQRQGDPSDP